MARYEIPSATVQGLTHQVTEDNAEWFCDCAGYSTGTTSECRHIKIAKLEKEGVFKEKIVFLAHLPLIKQYMDGGTRIQFEVSESEWDKIKELPHWRDVNLTITIEKSDL